MSRVFTLSPLKRQRQRHCRRHQRRRRMTLLTVTQLTLFVGCEEILKIKLPSFS